MSLRTLLGKNVKYYRFRKKITQEQLAETLDASSNYVGRLERGQHSPSLEKIEIIANALDIEPYELFIRRNDTDKLPNRVNLIDNNKK
ncbi:MAG: helix-turn-helix transcriptional regulator [Bacilli bacterium]|nr:helix-turn-helix transcriptional regulator [Bacilli bacterium]